MDVNNSTHTQCLPNMATNSWRNQQPRVSRQEAASLIINVLKQHYPFDDLTRIKNIALGMEQNIFAAATSQDDYMQKVAIKLSSIKAAYKNNYLHSLSSVPLRTHMYQQPVVQMQQQAVQSMPAFLPTQWRQSQPEPNVHKFVSHAQSPPSNFLEDSYLIHEEIKQAVPMSYCSFEAQQLILKRKQILQSRNTFPAQSANLKLEQGQVDENSWREEIYQWVQTYQKLFFPEVREIRDKAEAILSQIASAPQPQLTAQVENQHKVLRFVRCLIMLLELPRHKIEPKDKQIIAKIEKDLLDFFRAQELMRAMSLQHHKELPVPNMNAFQQSSYPHNQNLLQSRAIVLQSMQLKQLANQNRQREIVNMQQSLEFYAHQNPGYHLNLTEAMNVKQEMGNMGPPMQHHFLRQQQVVKLESPSPVSSPKLFQVPSIQPSQNSSPKKKQMNLQTSPEKTGTSAGVQQATGAGPAVAKSLQINTNELATSPVLISSNNKDNNSANFSECNPQESTVIEQPIQRLLRVVNSMPPSTLCSSVEALKEIYSPTALLIRKGTLHLQKYVRLGNMSTINFY